MIRRVMLLALAAVGVAVLGGCGEKLEGGGTCPVLCPQDPLQVRDTILDPVAFDTTVAGFPSFGSETWLLLASRGDSLETHAVVRFDTLPSKFTAPVGGDSTIDRVSGATIIARLVLPILNPSSDVTVELFDVDTTAADTVPSTLLPLFRDDRRIGSYTFTPSTIADSTLRVPISDSAVFDKIRTGSRLRVGMRVRGAQSVQLRLLSSSAASSGPRLSFRVREDTTVTCCVKTPVFTTSSTPETVPFIAQTLRDFTVVVRQPVPELPPGTLSVGGVSGRRSLLRFALPAGIVDSTSIIRATLLLTQRAAPGIPSAGDSVTLQVTVPAARAAITDLERQLSLATALYLAEGLGKSTTRDTLRVAPAQGEVREIELAPLLRRWTALGTEASLRSIVLRSIEEREMPGEIFFYSSEAAPELRPRIRITYVPRGGYGVP